MTLSRHLPPKKTTTFWLTFGAGYLQLRNYIDSNIQPPPSPSLFFALREEIKGRKHLRSMFLARGDYSPLR